MHFAVLALTETGTNYEIDHLLERYEQMSAQSADCFPDCMPYIESCYDDEDNRFYCNAEGIYDWYEIGGRWGVLPSYYGNDTTTIPVAAFDYKKFLNEKESVLSGVIDADRGYCDFDNDIWRSRESIIENFDEIFIKDYWNDYYVTLIDMHC